MKKYMNSIIKILTCLTMFSFVVGCVVLTYSDGWCGSMGTTPEAAAAANSTWDAAIAAGKSCAEAMEMAMNASAAALGATGVKGDFDGDGIPDNQQAKSTSTSTSSSAKPAKSSDQKTTAAVVENTQTEPDPEPVHEHNYHKEITTMPTCTEPGVETYTCDCGDSYTEEIPAKGHDEGEWSTVVEPTCTTEGKKELRCTNCNELLDEETIPALGHTPGDWEVTKEADWIHDGEQVRKCTVCGEILETQVIPANHTPLYIIGGCVLAVILLIAVIVVAKKKMK